MHDGLRPSLPEHAADLVAVADVEGYRRDGGAGAAGRFLAGSGAFRGVAGGDGGSPLDQSRHQAAADEPFGAGDEDARHVSALPCPNRSR